MISTMETPHAAATTLEQQQLRLRRDISTLDRMLSNEGMRDRLPDKGAALDARRQLLVRQLAAADGTDVGPQQVRTPPVASTSASKNTGGPGTGDDDAQRRLQLQSAIAAAEADKRTDTRAALERSFKGVLSTSEMARLAEQADGGGAAGSTGATHRDHHHHLFATWSETLTIIDEDREAERERELERLRRVCLPPDQRRGLRSAFQLPLS